VVLKLDFLKLCATPVRIGRSVKLPDFDGNEICLAASGEPGSGIMAYLVVLKGANAKEKIPLNKDRILLGRNANCDIVFPANDFAVSREHACIVRVEKNFFIEDLGSRNGTFVNNQQVTSRTQLTENDRVRICDFVYSFHDSLEASRPPLPSEYGPEPTIEEPENLSTFEASISHSSNVYLEAQPAEKLRVVLDILDNLSRTLELDSLLPKIVDNLFTIFKQADRCFIILREESLQRDKPVEVLIPKVIKTRRAQDETAANYSRSIVRECIKTVQAFLSDDAFTDKRFNMSQSIADFRIRSVMCAPLWSQEDNKAFGVIQLDTQDRTKKFTQDDLNLLMGVAKQASLAMENARLHETSLARERIARDLELAHQVQLSFLPSQLPEVPDYEFYAAYEPAQEVGGDYYGFISLPQQRLAIMLGDVAGKGVSAALLMAKLASDARFALASETEPAKAISTLNDLMFQNTSQMDRFVTLGAAILDPAANCLTFVNAGHVAPLLVRASTGKYEPAIPKSLVGFPLGIMEGASYESHQVTLDPGDCVLLFSDGVTEAMDKQNKQLDLKAVDAALQAGPLPPQSLGQRILKLVKQHGAGRSQHDDITLVCFGRKPPS
jgi:serine phosphatase RsbU (regulator of sigma subunit)